MPQYRQGQSVLYKPVGGPESHTSESVGIVQAVSTEPTEQAGRHVDASKEHPRYEIQNENTGKSTTIYEDNILGPV